MVQRFVIEASLPGANQLREMSPFIYARAKKTWGGVVALYARRAQLKPVEGPVYFEFHFLEKDKRRDPDNMFSGAAKIAVDALKEIGIIPGDGWKHVSGYSFSWEVSKTPGVVVTMRTG